LIAEIAGRVVGIGAAVFESVELRACYVAPDAGRKGVGSALVKEIEHAARAGGAAFRTGLFPDRRVFLSNYRL
jgi:putative acetyltransferase